MKGFGWLAKIRGSLTWRQKQELIKPSPLTPQEELALRPLFPRPRLVRNKKTISGNSLRTYSSMSPSEAVAAKAAYRLILRNYSKLKSEDLRLEDKQHGIVISQARDASEPRRGNVHWAILKVSSGGKDFFIKIDPLNNASRLAHSSAFLNQVLKKHNYSFRGFKVRAVSPILIHDFKKKTLPPDSDRFAILATEFYPQNEVQHVSGLKGKLWDRIDTALRDIRWEANRMGKMHFEQLHPQNAFYDSKTNTLILFDIGAIRTDYRHK